MKRLSQSGSTNFCPGLVSMSATSNNTTIVDANVKSVILWSDFLQVFLEFFAASFASQISSSTLSINENVLGKREGLSSKNDFTQRDSFKEFPPRCKDSCQSLAKILSFSCVCLDCEHFFPFSDSS